MVSAVKLIVLLGIIAFLAVQVDSEFAMEEIMCSPEEQIENPCSCCKRTCWFGIVKITPDYYESEPGMRNKAEARCTIAMMHHCLILECSTACLYSRQN